MTGRLVSIGQLPGSSAGLGCENSRCLVLWQELQVAQAELRGLRLQLHRLLEARPPAVSVATQTADEVAMPPYHQWDSVVDVDPLQCSEETLSLPSSSNQTLPLRAERQPVLRIFRYGSGSVGTLPVPSQPNSADSYTVILACQEEEVTDGPCIIVDSFHESAKESSSLDSYKPEESCESPDYEIMEEETVTAEIMEEETVTAEILEEETVTAEIMEEETVTAENFLDDDSPINKHNTAENAPSYSSIVQLALEIDAEDDPATVEVIQETEGSDDVSGDRPLTADARRHGATCWQCAAQFPTYKELDVHTAELHPGSGAHQCHKCSKVFLHRTSLRLHTRSVHDKQFMCKTCGKTFNQRSVLQKHEWRHTKQRPFSCSVCGKTFVGLKRMRQHETVVHGLEKADTDALGSVHPAIPHELRPFACSLCGKRFMHLGRMQRHEAVIHSLEKRNSDTSEPNPELQCPVCSKNFTLSCKLRKHLQIVHSEDRPHRCPTCGKCFKTKECLHSHTETHATVGRYVCQCGKRFKQQQALRSHLRTHTGERPYVCNICDRAFSVWITLHTHKLTHTGEKPFCCETCGTLFRQGGHLRRHMRTCNKPKPTWTPLEGQVVTASAPDFTSEPTLGNSDSKCLTSDHTSHNIFKPQHLRLQCGKCSKRFVTMEALQRHLDMHSDARPYACSCGMRFHHKDLLKGHSLIHSGERPYNCDICDRSFRQKTTLQAHRLIHTGEKPYSCKLCGQKFRQRGQLIRHKKKHPNLTNQSVAAIQDETAPASHSESCDNIETQKKQTEKQELLCFKCGRIFKKAHALRKHMNDAHTRDQPHICPDCGKGFSTAEYFRRHCEMHSTSRPLVCSCGLRFNHRQALRSHRRIHTGERPYKCDVCNRQFRQWSCLNLHKMIHTGDKPLKCSFCDRRFRQRSNILKHVRMAHPTKAHLPTKTWIQSEEREGAQLTESTDKAQKLKKALSHKNSAAQGEPSKPSKSSTRYSTDATDRPFVCSCGARFKDPQVLKKHNLIHTGERPHQCDICGRLFRERSTLKTHRFIHTGEKPLKCNVCDGRFRQRIQLVKHIQKVHPNEPTQPTDSVVEGQGEIEPTVAGSASVDTEPHETLEASYSETSLPSENSRCQEELSLDSKSVHNVSTKESHEKDSGIHSTGRRYTCICGAQFKNQQVLKRHTLIHTGDRPFKCDVCSRQFRQKTTLTAHKLIHTGEKPYSCKTCDERFRQRGQLLKHVRLTHQTETIQPPESSVQGISAKHESASASMFPYTDLPESFVSIKEEVDELNSPVYSTEMDTQPPGSHMEIKEAMVAATSAPEQRSVSLEESSEHSEPSPANEPLCAQPEMDCIKQSKDQHSLVDTDFRPYECDICGSCFRQRSTLLAHRLIHTGEKPYGCKTCGKTFRQRGHLIRHAKTHSTDTATLAGHLL